MSADEHADELLCRAGEQWRSQHPAPAAVDFATITATAPASGGNEPPVVPITHPAPTRGWPSRRRTQVWVASVVAIAAAIVATLLVVRLGGTSKHGGPGTTPATAALSGTDWTLTGLRKADGTSLAVISPASLTFAGDGASIAGTDGCNHFGGTVTIRAGDIAIGNIASTAMGCVDRPAGFADEVALIDAVLNASVQWSVTGGQLTITRAGAGTLVYQAVTHTTTTDPKSLTGVTWRLVTIEQGGVGGTASTPAAPASIHFDNSGKLTGDDGCNAITASTVPGRGTLEIGLLGQTYKLCSGARNDQETFVQSVLHGNVRWSISDGRLTITKLTVGSLVFAAG